jgi:DNA-binding CsgD family transcriptional regulator
MRPTDHLLHLIQQLYAAAGSHDGWKPFLESLRGALGGSAATFMFHGLGGAGGIIESHTNVQADPELIRVYQQAWMTFDPWANSPKLLGMLDRSVIVGDELVPHEQMKRTDFYNEYARRFETVRMMAGIVEAAPGALSIISINRDERDSAFGESDVALLEPLVPHIRQAVHLHRRLITAEFASIDFAKVIDSSSRAVMLVDATGTVTFLNRAAARLSARRDGLTVERGELRGARTEDTIRVRSLLEKTIKASRGEGTDAGAVLTLGRPSGLRPFVVLVSPVVGPRWVFPGMAPTAAALFVSDPEETPAPNEEGLRSLFALTRAEARLARLLAQGVTLKEAERHLGVGRETIRTQLKAIFLKTNTNRQADLVRLLLNGVPGI